MAILQTLLTVASVASLATGYELKATYDASNFFDDSSFRLYNGWDKFTHDHLCITIILLPCGAARAA